VRTRSVVFDAILAAVVLAAVEVEAWVGGDLATHRQGPHWAQATAYGIAALALVARRFRPLPSLLVGCGALALEFVAVGSPEGFGVMIPPLIAAYTVANREDRRTALEGLAAVLALGVVWVEFDPMNDQPVKYLEGLVWLSPWVIAWLLGAYLRTRRLVVQGLLREQDERAAAAVAEERNRIARELHDSIGHSVSVMTVQASAVRRLMRPDQPQERAALETVEATGREAMAEMRRLVGVLRSAEEGPDWAPPPTLAQLDRLFENCRRAGLEVELQISGDLSGLPPGLDLTAFRLVQEGLTNTLKHADARRASVNIVHDRAVLTVAVCDDGRGPVEDGRPGNGLRGLQERVGLYGGRMSTAGAPGGGYELRAELPVPVS
jgi:signal transduction histidine kinase